MTREDYYKILGVDKNASQDDIKKAFRAHVRKSHPDKFTDPKVKKQKEEEFKKIVAANDVLSDTNKRRNYDAGFGENGSYDQGFGRGAGAGGFGGFQNAQGFQGFSSRGGNDIFEEIFNAFTGGRGRTKKKKNIKQSGNNIRTSLNISIKEAYFGCEKTIKLQYNRPCQTCEATGQGADAKGRRTTPSECGTCKGEGVMQQNIGFSFDIIKCPQCLGSGIEIVNPCSDCNGQGRSLQYYKHNLNIPAGILHGHKIVLSNQGEAGVRGGKAGDLFIILYVDNSEDIELKGIDVHKKINIDMFQAAMGVELKVKTVSESTIVVNIPAGCQDQTVLRVNKKGFIKYNSNEVGDMFLNVSVKIPKITKGENVAMLKEVADKIKSDKAQGFFSKYF